MKFSDLNRFFKTMQMSGVAVFSISNMDRLKLELSHSVLNECIQYWTFICPITYYFPSLKILFERAKIAELNHSQ